METHISDAVISGGVPNSDGAIVTSCYPGVRHSVPSNARHFVLVTSALARARVEGGGGMRREKERGGGMRREGEKGKREGTRISSNRRRREAQAEV